MCADKFRRTFPLKITFSDGERPSSQKLTAVSEQSRNAMRLIEQVVGDTWNQAGDAALTSYPLLIPTIARMIGQNKYLNPVIYPMEGDFQFIESIGEKYIGRNEFHLTYKPKDGTVASITCAGTNLSGSPQTNERDVDSANEYWVDNDTGRFRSYLALSGDETVTYTVDTTEWLLGNETLPGIIPDPRQADFTSCRVEDATTKYYIHLPPRLPLTLDSDRERPVSYPSSLSSEITANSASSTASPQKFWQQSGINALTGIGSAHYRYALPYELQQAFTAGDIAPGEEIPQGFLYLYDIDNDVLLEDVVFKRPLSGDTGYTLEVSSNTFDFSTVTGNDDESETTYNASGLILVSCGSPISRVLWAMMSALFKHKHEKGQTLDATVSHSDLDDNNPPSADYATGDGHNSRYPTHLPSWFPSNWSHDTHTSLLSRAGAQTDSRKRDKFNNAMLGHLILANADTSGSENYLDDTCPNDSFKLYFGDVDGSYIFSDAGHICLMPDTNKYTGINTTPSLPLHVYHATIDTGIGIESGDTYALIGFKDNASTGWNTKIGCIGDELSLFTDGAEVVRIDDEGRVGIGTTSPEILGSGSIGGNVLTVYDDSSNAQLTVRSAALAALHLEDTGASANNKIIQLRTDGGYTKFVTVNDDVTQKAGDVLTINHSTGYVGIGKVATGAYLEVAGALNAESLSISDTSTNVSANIIASSGGYSSRLYLYNQSNYWLFNHDNSDSNKLHLKYNNSTKVTFTTDGKVGIGDTTPSYPLDVTGTVRFIDTVYVGDGTGSGFVQINSTAGNDATLRLDVGSGEWDIKNKSNTSYQLQFRYNNAIKFYIATDGEIQAQGDAWIGGFMDATTVRANDFYWESLGTQTRYIYLSPFGAIGTSSDIQSTGVSQVNIYNGGEIEIPIPLPQYSQIQTIELYFFQPSASTTKLRLYRKLWNGVSSAVTDEYSVASGQLITISGINHTVSDGYTYCLQVKNTDVSGVSQVYGARITISETRVPVYNYTL